MRHAYIYAYRTFSPWEHSSASRFKGTIDGNGDSWRRVGDRSPFQGEDIEAVGASMYAYFLESVLASIKPEAATLAREVRDYVTVHWVRSDLVDRLAEDQGAIGTADAARA